MKELGSHEDCIQQMVRLFHEHLYGDSLKLDAEGRIRVDDWEMDPQVQQAVAEIWPRITSDNLNDLSDFSDYQSNFLQLFGFNIPGVDYNEDVEVDLTLPSSL